MENKKLVDKSINGGRFKYSVGAEAKVWIEKLPPFSLSRNSKIKRSLRCVQTCTRCLCISFDMDLKTPRGIAELLMKLIIVLVLSLLVLDGLAHDKRLHSIVKSLESSDSIPGRVLGKIDNEIWSYLVYSGKSCQMLEESKMRYGNITIVRIVGPSLPPLQSPDQQSYNLEHILRNEIEVQMSSACIRQVWVITCMYNKTEEAKIRKSLQKFNQEFYKVPECTEDESSKLLEQLKDVNSARNFGISKALMQPTDWVLPLDGNIFLPADALEKIVHGLIVDDYLGHKIHVIPLFRVLRCQTTFFDNNFEIDSEFQNSFVQLSRHYPVITDNLSRKQEGQIAVSTDLDNIESFFSPEEKYSHRSKLGLIARLKEGNSRYLRCGAAAGLEHENNTEVSMLFHVHTCGYAVRLVYWPKYDECPFIEKPVLPELAMNRFNLKKHKKEVTKRADVNSRARSHLRKKSVKRLESTMHARHILEEAELNFWAE